jgi:hypothetical protein
VERVRNPKFFPFFPLILDIWWLNGSHKFSFWVI